MPLDDNTPRDDAALTPPNNLSAEAAVLGAILFDNAAFQRISDLLRPTDFYAPAHQELFEVSQTIPEEAERQAAGEDVIASTAAEQQAAADAQAVEMKEAAKELTDQIGSFEED